jgi:hypothetical protein
MASDFLYQKTVREWYDTFTAIRRLQVSKEPPAKSLLWFGFLLSLSRLHKIVARPRSRDLKASRSLIIQSIINGPCATLFTNRRDIVTRGKRARSELMRKTYRISQSIARSAMLLCTYMSFLSVPFRWLPHASAFLYAIFCICIGQSESREKDVTPDAHVERLATLDPRDLAAN